MSRKRIVQLLTSLAVLSCMVLPVQAAPPVNIVPLVQLLLLAPAEVEITDSGMWDGVNPVLKNEYLTTDVQACFFGSYEIEPTSRLPVKIEWFYDDNLYVASIDGVFSPGPTNWAPGTCILMAGDNSYTPALAPPPPSPSWMVKVSIDGRVVDQQGFTITAAP